MTTVIDPTRTPIPVYNRSGTTIVEVSGGSSPTPIPHISGTTIVLLDMSTGNKVELPANAEIGDTIEVYRTSGSPGDAYTPTGETFVRGSNVEYFDGIYRKVSDTQWAPIVSHR